MKKIIWRVSRAAISAALVGGALLAAGGSATAATSKADERITVVESEGQNLPGHGSRNVGDGYASEQKAAHDRRPDPWVAGQLAMFDPWITDQLAMFDPWITDQLAMFAPGHAQ
ncbi:hypothetical protein [Streptomyces sp. NPDC001307]|uniref:hypothetical protein n=1 Tax=Streptomyces sp. NPDC001307 TaxID=3364560 RepID=UPI0036AF9B5C